MLNWDTSYPAGLTCLKFQLRSRSALSAAKRKRRAAGRWARSGNNVAIGERTYSASALWVS